MDFLELLTKVSTSIGSKALEEYHKNKLKILRDEVLCEIRGGDFSRVQEEDLISISYRLYNDTIEGVAKNNLRLMCQVIRGMNEKNILTAQNFRKYADVLASLDEEEVYLLGKIAKHYNKLKHTDTRFSSKSIDDAIVEILGREFVKEEPEISHFESLLQGLLRTGLIMQNTGFAAEGVEYEITLPLINLIKYTDFIIKTEDERCTTWH